MPKPKFIYPLPDFTKTFYINVKKSEIESFENNGTIWSHKPFLDYLELFDEKFGYTVSAHINKKLFGGQTYIFTVEIYKMTKGD